MKLRIAVLAAIIFMPLSAYGQGSHVRVKLASTSPTTPASAIVTWNAATVPANSPPVTSYNILRATTSGAESLLASVGNVLTYTDSTVVGPNTYYYTVEAVNSVGPSAQSSPEAVAVIPAPAPVALPPNAPSGVSVTVTQVTITQVKAATSATLKKK